MQSVLGQTNHRYTPSLNSNSIQTYYSKSITLPSEIEYQLSPTKQRFFEKQGKTDWEFNNNNNNNNNNGNSNMSSTFAQTKQHPSQQQQYQQTTLVSKAVISSPISTKKKDSSRSNHKHHRSSCSTNTSQSDEFISGNTNNTAGVTRSSQKLQTQSIAKTSTTLLEEITSLNDRTTSPFGKHVPNEYQQHSSTQRNLKSIQILNKPTKNDFTTSMNTLKLHQLKEKQLQQQRSYIKHASLSHYESNGLLEQTTTVSSTHTMPVLSQEISSLKYLDQPSKMYSILPINKSSKHKQQQQQQQPQSQQPFAEFSSIEEANQLPEQSRYLQHSEHATSGIRYSQGSQRQMNSNRFADYLSLLPSSVELNSSLNQNNSVHHHNHSHNSQKANPLTFLGSSKSHMKLTSRHDTEGDTITTSSLHRIDTSPNQQNVLSRNTNVKSNLLRERKKMPSLPHQSQVPSISSKSNRKNITALKERGMTNRVPSLLNVLPAASSTNNISNEMQQQQHQENSASHLTNNSKNKSTFSINSLSQIQVNSQSGVAKISQETQDHSEAKKQINEANNPMGESNQKSNRSHQSLQKKTTIEEVVLSTDRSESPVKKANRSSPSFVAITGLKVWVKGAVGRFRKTRSLPILSAAEQKIFDLFERFVSIMQDVTKLPKIYQQKSYRFLFDLWSRHSDLRTHFLDKSLQQIISPVHVTARELLTSFSFEKLKVIYEDVIHAEKLVEPTYDYLLDNFFRKDITIYLVIIEEYVLKAQQSELNRIEQQMISQQNTIKEMEMKLNAHAHASLSSTTVSFQKEYAQKIKSTLDSGTFLFSQQTQAVTKAEKKYGSFDQIQMNQKLMGGFIQRIFDNIRKNKQTQAGQSSSTTPKAHTQSVSVQGRTNP